MMTSELDEDEGEPQRDERGRYKKGVTGNPNGRPRKKPERPKSLAKCFAEGLVKEVALTDKGIPHVLEYRELLIESVLRGAVKSKPKEALHILERLERFAAEAAEEEEEDECEEFFTDEDRKWLEKMQQEMRESFCCRCERPVFDNSPQTPIAGGFPFG